MKHLLASIIILLFLSGCCCPSGNISKPSVNNQSSTTTSVNTPVPEKPIQVNAGQLIQEYKDNGVAADNKYKDKTLKVTGTINSIDKDILNSMYVTLSGEETNIVSVQCYFSEDKNEQLASLKKDEKITITGKCNGKSMNVILKNCEL